MRSKIPGGYNSLINLTDWLNDNINDDDLVMVANTQDVPYLSKGKYFYDYRLFFVDEERLIYYLPNYPNFRYIVISESQINPEFTNWIIIPSNSPLLKMLNEEKYFDKVYDQNTIKVYKIRYDKFLSNSTSQTTNSTIVS